MVTSAERGKQVRQQLLTAALELIPERGWHAVSTRQLAERAGVAPGLVHYHFDSLPALLRVAAVGAMRETVSEVEDVLTEATDAATGLDLMLRALDDYTGTDPTSLLFVETYLAATRDEALRADLADVLAGFRDRLTHWLDGIGTPDPANTAAVLAASIDGLLLHRALHPDLTARAVSPVLLRVLTAREGN